MEAIFPPDPGFPLEIIEEPTLSEGQVFLRCGDVERVIDTSGALSDIETGIADFFSSQQGSLKANG
jgi:flagellar assembly protein FliH